LKLKFRTVAEKTAKNFRRLLFFAAPGLSTTVMHNVKSTRHIWPMIDCNLAHWTYQNMTYETNNMPRILFIYCRSRLFGLF